MRTLRARLMLAYTALIVVGFGALAVLAGGQIARGSMEDFAQSLSAQAALLARTLRENRPAETRAVWMSSLKAARSSSLIPLSFPVRSPIRPGGFLRPRSRMSWMFRLARLFRTSGLQRLYIYNWTGAGCQARFDAGLTAQRPSSVPAASR